MWRKFSQMEKLIIEGTRNLNGQIEISSSKNAYLPILAACILCEEKVVLHKNPKFSDIYDMCDILKHLGAKIEFHEDDIIIDSSTIDKFEIPSEMASVIRSSIFSLGSILGRFGVAKVAFPGGCEIGARPIDIHIKGLETLNVNIVDRHGYLHCDGKNMRGAPVHLDFPSVGATENIMMAAVLVNGRTDIYNAAKEPEIVDLENFLCAMGARVRGAGTSHIVIYGVERLHGVEYSPISDRIITGTYLLAGIMCGGEIELSNANLAHVGTLASKFQNSSCKLTYRGDKIHLISTGKYSSIEKIETMPFPGFPTDLQAQLMACLTVANGTSVIVENLFESRFKQVPELVKLGAKITVKDRTAVINGVKNLYGAQVTAHDLRGGVSLVLAGLRAEGYTTIENAHYIDRGYYQIENELSNLGAKIQRIVQ